MLPSKTKFAYIAWTNTDLTEGRGREIPLAICECEATAKRLGAKKYVQGGDCSIEKIELWPINNKWYGPINLIAPSYEDKVIEDQLRDAEAALAAKMIVLEKAKALGLTEEDIEILKG